jgi:hypothetical protein
MLLNLPEWDLTVRPVGMVEVQFHVPPARSSIGPLCQPSGALFRSVR